MSSTFTYHRRVEFCETDAAGIAHFSAYFQYMEQAEHAFWRHLGTSVVATQGEATRSWPRVKASFEYFGAARFEQQLQIDLSIIRLGEKSVTFHSAISSEGKKIASGSITAVCCLVEPHGLKSIPIPSELKTLLLPYLDSSESNQT